MLSGLPSCCHLYMEMSVAFSSGLLPEDRLSHLLHTQPETTLAGSEALPGAQKRLAGLLASSRPGRVVFICPTWRKLRTRPPHFNVAPFRLGGVCNPVIQWSCKILQPLEKTHKRGWTCQAQHILKSNLVLIKFILTLEGREEGKKNHIFYDSSLPQDNKT